MRRDVRQGVESEVRGIGGWRWNWVSPDRYWIEFIDSNRLILTRNHDYYAYPHR